jgi:peroxidase
MDGRRKPGRPIFSRRWRRGWLNPWLVTGVAVAMVGGIGGIAFARTGAGIGVGPFATLEVQSLNGSGNNLAHPNTWGVAGQPYARVTAAHYGDGRGSMMSGPNPRAVSDRIINDVTQNIFSENAVSAWGWAFGQFMDHNIGLAQGGTGAASNIPFNANDPMEKFTDNLGVIPFTRDAAAPGTGTSTTNPRQQINTLSSYIDGFNVYGGDNTRLEWLRDGPVNGNMADNAATLMLPGGYLPSRDTRGNAATAPTMAVDGRLLATPAKAAVAGDVRANENIVLTAIQTLFAREHNRIVGVLPNTLSAEDKFQIARRIVIAEIQFITYNEFLPAMGVHLPAYTGYKSTVDPSLTNEFATVGYRGHSQIHGDIEVETESARYTQAQLDQFTAEGMQVEAGDTPDVIKIAIPDNVMFFDPEVLKQVGEGPVLQALSLEPQYKNDMLIDDELRSTLFQVPKPGSTSACDEPAVDPACFTGVTDLGAIDVQRGRDHGMPTYNQLRVAYGLPPARNFADVVGSGPGSENFPRDPKLTPGNEINQPAALDFTALFDVDGNPIALNSPDAQSRAVNSKRRTPLAARLRAVYHDVNTLDAFVGMQAEPHLPGSDMGALENAIWAKQFTALRDGDRFFYGNLPVLTQIKDLLGLDFHTTMAQLIGRNTDIPLNELPANVFKSQFEPPSAAAKSTVDGKAPDFGTATVPGQVAGRPEQFTMD